MTFEEILDQAIAILQRRGRLTYGALKRQFNLDDAFLEDLKEELIYGQRLAMDEDGKVLVFTGAANRTSDPSPASAFAPATETQRAPLSYTPAYLTEKILDARHRLEGERKQVTVLFADIKDSTELIRDLDPEAAQQLLDPALRRMMDAVHRYEGTVNQVLGDGIMALFGAPIAHEDHALRACYAALAMQAAMRDYTEGVRRAHGLELRLRVGLNSGEVVVRAIGNDLHMDYSAVGQTTHLAARMEQLATPGSIRLTAATLRLVEGLVRLNALGPIPVKGLPEAVEVYELVGANAGRRRLQAAAARGLTRFVGRDTEIAALAQALERANAGHGQIVATVGEAGVGKSRLLYEFVHSYRTQGWLVLEAASVSYGKATPYFPIIDLLKRYVHVEDGDEPRTVRAKVTGHVLTLDEALQDTIPALLALLEALPADSPFLTLDPTQRRLRTLAGLKRVLLRETQVQPLLLIFEDLHWIDAETQALLDSLMESLPTARLLMLVNYRPEYQHTWGQKTYYTQLRLDPLPPQSAEAFLQALLGDDHGADAGLPLGSLTQLLIARTEGNPFFLEESVRTLVETGVLVGEPGAYRLVKPLDTLQVPATVQAVLAARIDRLSVEDKRLLQTAAVIGTVVPFPLLQAIAELPEAALHRSLAHLQMGEFLYETRLFPDREYTFKHALTHEVAYSGLLQERRRALHARIVEALESLARDRMAEQVERLAHHGLRGEIWDKAVIYCRQAGEKAMARSAYREAAESFEQALVALSHLPEQRDTREQAIDLRLALRSALLPSGDSGRILACLREAEALAVAIDDHLRLGHISGFLSVYFRNIGAYDQSIAAAQRALELATTGGDSVVQALANLYLGAAYWAQGSYVGAIDCLQQTVAALQGAQRRERLGQATVPSVQALAFLAVCHAELGRFAEGRALGEEGLRLAETVAHPSTLMWACYGIGLLSLCQGDLHRALPLLEQAMGICREADLRLFVPRMAAAMSAGYTSAGRVAEAISLLMQAMEQTTASDMAGFQALCRLPLGEAHLRAGRFEEAQTLAECALSIAREQQERGNEAYALRLLGEVAAHRDPPASAVAQSHYQQALTLADELGMRPLMAHCHLGLGSLLLRLGMREQAHSELSAAMAMYRGMEMRFWVPHAEAALAQAEALG
ncbi:MAG TPA: adenylate/guanylate cyclase domain-containing protein [Candidatus Tectomicrobia bacterium]|nr:adenylate/guanylate cyclase domain-containing protein [Candidatus Tectomicrobia bacterium]